MTVLTVVGHACPVATGDCHCYSLRPAAAVSLLFLAADIRQSANQQRAQPARGQPARVTSQTVFQARQKSIDNREMSKSADSVACLFELLTLKMDETLRIQMQH